MASRVFSAYVKEVEGKPSATVWGKKMTFGNLMSEFSNGGGIFIRMHVLIHFATLHAQVAGFTASLSPPLATSWLGLVTILVSLSPMLLRRWRKLP